MRNGRIAVNEINSHKPLTIISTSKAADRNLWRIETCEKILRITSKDFKEEHHLFADHTATHAIKLQQAIRHERRVNKQE